MKAVFHVIYSKTLNVKTLST